MSDHRKKHEITRKEFIDGLLVTGAALSVPSIPSAAQTANNPDGTTKTVFQALGISEEDPRYYPPALSGMRGSHPGSYPAGHALRDGQKWVDQPPADTGEAYDLVIVGAGISGLSSAHFYLKERPGARILIIENHDDFGGHAKRNEFRSQGKLLLGYGGTQAIEELNGYSNVAKGLLRDIGIDTQRFYKFYDQKFRGRHGLANAVFFDRETFGQDVLVPNHSVDPDGNLYDLTIEAPRYKEFLAQTPLAEQAQKDLIALQSGGHDPLPGKSLDEKIHYLRHISYTDFLTKVIKVHPDVIKYLQKISHGGFGMGIDAVDALIGCGMTARGLMRAMGFPQRHAGEPYIFHFPDGNASIARMLVRKLIPGAAPGNTMEDIVTTRFSYPALDLSNNQVRIRLNSTVVAAHNTEHGTELTYMHEGKAYKVRSKHAILACWHMIIPYMCPELPEKQKAAMHANVKVPLVYGTVQIRNWKALKALGVGYTYCPGAYFSEVMMDFPVSMGNYHYTDAPDQSCVLHLVRTPCSPGKSARDQHLAGRYELYGTPLAAFEERVRDQLGRMYKKGGFDAQRDIAAITINRWPHGYTYYHMPLWDGDVPEEQRFNVVARQKFGNISIANTDADVDAETNYAIDQAFRATKEVLAT